MRVRLTRRALQDFEKLSPALQSRSEKQFGFLASDLRHPSLNAKKHPQAGEGIWQGRIDRSYRFYFAVEADVYLILRIIPHPK